MGAVKTIASDPKLSKIFYDVFRSFKITLSAVQVANKLGLSELEARERLNELVAMDALSFNQGSGTYSLFGGIGEKKSDFLPRQRKTRAREKRAWGMEEMREICYCKGIEVGSYVRDERTDAVEIVSKIGKNGVEFKFKKGNFCHPDFLEPVEPFEMEENLIR